MIKKLFFLLLSLLLIFGCQTPHQSGMKDYSEAGPVVFTLQLLHFADIDGNEEIALSTVDEFSALVNAFSQDSMYGPSTLILSSGDNMIPGPRFYAAEQSPVRAVTGSNEPGHVDIGFLNALGVRASAVGNHELDAGPGEFADAISSEEKKGVVFPGSLFPYLSANLDFSTEEDFKGMIGENGKSSEELKGKLSASTVAMVNGEKIGIVGASTPLLHTITNTGDITVKPASASIKDLAGEIQPFVDELIGQGANKIILLSHMQQIAIEKELAGYLRGVDIIVAGGSNTRMGDKDDALFEGDDAFAENYPYITKDADNNPVCLVNVDGDYKYLGRLVIGFSQAGIVNLGSLKPEINGAWASTAANVQKTGGQPIGRVIELRDAVQSVINAQYGNVLGYTLVYLDGRRSQVRTQETNLGNLSADANLWYANQLFDGIVDVSLKNGGGIRTEIGAAIVPPGSVDYAEAKLVPPPASEETGVGEGAITEGHLRATLRFDNGLTLLSVTAQELKILLEHAISATRKGATPGQFPQIGGMRFVFDATASAGSRIQELVVLDNQGGIKDSLVKNGQIQGDPGRRFRMVTLNFLANGGDAYPFDQLSDPRRINLYEGKGYGEKMDYPDANLDKDPGMNNAFSYTGGEQDALAEYLKRFHGTKGKAFNLAETDHGEDTRIRY